MYCPGCLRVQHYLRVFRLAPPGASPPGGGQVSDKAPCGAQLYRKRERERKYKPRKLEIGLYTRRLIFVDWLPSTTRLR